MKTGRYAASALLALAACSSHKSKLDDIGPSSVSSVTAATNGSAAKPHDEAPARVAVTPKKIAPMIHEIGAEHVVPTSVVIELAAPIVDREHVGEVSSRSAIKLTPEIAGTLTYSAESELTFTPERPFKFNTQYKVELE